MINIDYRYIHTTICCISSELNFTEKPKSKLSILRIKILKISLSFLFICLKGTVINRAYPYFFLKPIELLQLSFYSAKSKSKVHWQRLSCIPLGNKAGGSVYCKIVTVLWYFIKQSCLFSFVIYSYLSDNKGL